MVDWAGLVAPGSAQQLLRSVVVGWLWLARLLRWLALAFG
jgi:hypothetical protein